MSSANPDNPALAVGAPSRIAFQAPTTNLWLAQEETHLGMMPGTSPSIVPSGAGGATEVAFHANTVNLWMVGTDNRSDTHLGMMMEGTSPSICPLADRPGWQVAFQANTGNLWGIGPDNKGDMHLGMMPGTSPSICMLTTGGWQVAFHANTGNLWVVGADNRGDTHLGMMPATSPSIHWLGGGGWEVAFQANASRPLQQRPRSALGPRASADSDRRGAVSFLLRELYSRWRRLMIAEVLHPSSRPGAFGHWPAWAR